MANAPPGSPLGKRKRSKPTPMLRVEGAGVTTVDGQYYDAGLVDGLRAYEKTNPNGSVVRVSLYNNTAALAASKAAALEAGVSWPLVFDD